MNIGKKKLFIIADAGCDTGFAQVTHNIVENLWTQWDIHILGINYHGDPHPIQQKAKIYNPAARTQGDFYGTARVKELIKRIEPDLVFLINDPWVGTSYTQLLEKYQGPKVLYTPVDGTNLKKPFVQPLEAYEHIICYTNFGMNELRNGGLVNRMSVIPHGVNKKIFKPVDINEAREKNKFGNDWFIVNVTDRNQIRKRIDLALYYFAEWVKDKPDTVRLHYHGALQDEGWDLLQIAEYLGINDRMIITHPFLSAQNGVPVDMMPWFYGCSNIGLSTTMGEG